MPPPLRRLNASNVFQGLSAPNPLGIDEEKLAAITGQPNVFTGGGVAETNPMAMQNLWAAKDPITGATIGGVGQMPQSVDPRAEHPLPSVIQAALGGKLYDPSPLAGLADPTSAANMRADIGANRPIPQDSGPVTLGGTHGFRRPGAPPDATQPTAAGGGGPGAPDFGSLEGTGKKLEQLGIYKQKAALGFEEGHRQEGAQREYDATMRGINENRALLDSEATKQAIEAKELDSAHKDLMQQYKDLQQQKVDPSRLFSGIDGGMAFIGGAIADGVWAGTSWLYGKAPGEGGPNAIQKMVDFAHRDTEHQLRMIDQGRANINAGTQLLNERINETKNRRAAALEMTMRKLEASKLEVGAEAQRTDDQVKIDKLRGIAGGLDKEQGSLMLDWLKEKKRDAAAAAAAKMNAARLELDAQEKAANLALKTYEAQTGRIKAMNEGEGSVGKIEQRLVQLPGTNRYVAAASPDAKAKIEGSLGEFDTAYRTLQQIAKDRQALKDAATGNLGNPLKTVTDTYAARQRLKSSVADYKTAVKNGIAKSGAALSPQESELLDSQVGDLESVVKPGSDQVLGVAEQMLNRHREGLTGGLGGAQFEYDGQGNLVRVGQGQQRATPSTATGGADLPYGRPAAGQ